MSETTNKYNSINFVEAMVKMSVDDKRKFTSDVLKPGEYVGWHNKKFSLIKANGEVMELSAAQVNDNLIKARFIEHFDNLTANAQKYFADVLTKRGDKTKQDTDTDKDNKRWF